jgi:sulfonate transport system substrate-binding protein
MERTFNRLGWRVPAQPPILPAGWAGTVGKPPYPEYLSFLNMKAPQPFPEAGDLVRPWSFNGQMFKP